MKSQNATYWRAGIVLSLAATAITGTAVTHAGPGCMNDQRHMSRGYYPYGPMGPQPAYGRPAPYGYYATPAPAAGKMTPRYNPSMTAQYDKRGGVAQPVKSAVTGTMPVKATQAASAMQSEAKGENVTVRIYGMRFEPASLNITPGTTVTWIQDSRMPHTVSGDADGLRSSTLNPGQQFSHTFDAAGNYTYACDLHPSMKGSVVVKETGMGT